MPRALKTNWRTAHGNARAYGRLVALESTPADELPPAIPGPPGPPERDPSGRFLPGNRAGLASRVRAGKRGALSELEKKGDAAARAASSYGRRYAGHRRTELAKLHGGQLSSCVGTTIESEGELLAAGRYWQARSIAEGNPDYARLAATLLAGARQAARDAWELATREADARRRPSPWQPAWLTTLPQDAPSASGTAASDNAPADATTRQPDATTREGGQ